MSHGLRVALSGGVVRVTLARPEVKNAFDAELIADLTQTLCDHAKREDIHALVIGADGPMFCAGADFNWMRSQKDADLAANKADAQFLYDMFFELYKFPHPTIARVQGGAFGGGVGLVACCDFVVMADDATLAFSEVKIGLVPATISPFVIRKIGEGRARELFLTGAVITAAQACTTGLANVVVSANDLDSAVEEYLERLKICGPHALTMTKEVLREVPSLTLSEARAFTAEMIAKQRVSEEGQEGMAAFLEKRKPAWAK
jgi:methylglutaconyl-CoA hydratase